MPLKLGSSCGSWKNAPAIRTSQTDSECVSCKYLYRLQVRGFKSYPESLQARYLPNRLGIANTSSAKCMLRHQQNNTYYDVSLYHSASNNPKDPKLGALNSSRSLPGPGIAAHGWLTCNAGGCPQNIDLKRAEAAYWRHNAEPVCRLLHAAQVRSLDLDT